ncbi:MAG: hypothetical protein N3A69_16775, partial [Leptospiraceae bacterium]|nr:hypothetical protein [Leptospiraceae bacterium]
MDILELYNELKPALGEEAAQVLSKSLGKIYIELTNKVTREDFSELKEIVARLSLAQERTEKRVEELALAQERTEKRVEELAKAQERTEKRVEELAKAQERTEKRVEELALAQERTEKKLEELAESLKETQTALLQLAESHKLLARQVGGLSASVGYGIEDQLSPYFPRFAKKVYGIQEITEYTLRKNIIYGKGKFDEINIYLKGRFKNETVYLLGECKSQPSKKEIENFMRVLERFASLEDGKIYPFFVAQYYNPEIEEYLK